MYAYLNGGERACRAGGVILKSGMHATYCIEAIDESIYIASIKPV
jgi:hypothetical protein